MRTIDTTTRFERDYKREAKGEHRATLDASLKAVFDALVNDRPLDPKYRDHPLRGRQVQPRRDAQAVERFSDTVHHPEHRHLNSTS